MGGWVVEGMEHSKMSVAKTRTGEHEHIHIRSTQTQLISIELWVVFGMEFSPFQILFPNTRIHYMAQVENLSHAFNVAASNFNQ